MNEVINNIKNEISENDVVLYMKGTSSMPQCGSSSRVAGVLNYLKKNRKMKLERFTILLTQIKFLMKLQNL